MKDAAPQRIYRADYQAPAYWIEQTDLHFDLGEEQTLVRARLQLQHNPDSAEQALTLHGEHLQLQQIKLDGRELAADEYELTANGLHFPNLPQGCELETLVAIKPQDNTRLEGLYKAARGTMFCTQCEAEGFRHITYYLDRPDVMAPFSVTIEADKARYPVLLSNGNRLGSEELPDGRLRVQWEDPYPKPSYLFALVAGDLRCHRGSFTTRSGREVALEIWVEPQNISKCEHALRSLQKAMRWDEEVFGLEYDLDLYMIVATDDFNMGAMENKGLNVFNSKFVLSLQETATDKDFHDIESVIGHEYFHNWTGNRVTCRDWFQLTLKEGLTVFRDQQFSADMSSPTVTRIDEVKILRSAQFAEDAGPMAHPIRPESYIEMNNFYTVTVYNKGAEVIRLYHSLLGADGFRKGMDLYFQRHDGQAVTCDDFRAAMADANGLDLSQFERWYSQAGTPTLRIREQYDPASQTYHLDVSQSGPAQAEGAAYQPLPIPLRLGLLDEQGRDLPLRLIDEAEAQGTTRVLVCDQAEQRFSFADIPARPRASLLRDFSAPVKLDMARERADLAFLMAHDSDEFNRWDAGQTLATELLLEQVADWRAGRELHLDDGFAQAFAKVLADDSLDLALQALMLELPEEKALAQHMEQIDVDGLHRARSVTQRALAERFRAELQAAYQANQIDHGYRLDKTDIGKRRLKNVLLEYLSLLDGDAGAELALRQFRQADNMSDAEGALKCLVNLPGNAREQALGEFYTRWKDEPLVLDKWFQLQAQSQAEDTVDRVLELAGHADFNLKNPNRARSLAGAFSQKNQAYFHAADGRGYHFLADIVLQLDPLNPQTAARLVSAFNLWKRFDPARQALMRGQLERIAAQQGLSSDVYEIVSRSLAD